MKPNQASNFKPVALPPQGSTPARCYSIIDIGTVPNIFKGKLNPDYPTTKKIFITFEIPAYKAVFVEEKGAQPFAIHVEFSHVYSEKSNLTKFLQAWMNRALTDVEKKTFDIGKKAIGKTCLLSYIHKRKIKDNKEVALGTDGKITNENTYLKFNGIMQLPATIQCPPQINPSLVWDWSEVETSKVFDLALFNKIPGFVRAKMMESEEYKKFAPKEAANPITDEHPSAQSQSNDFGSPGESEVTGSGLAESWGG